MWLSGSVHFLPQFDFIVRLHQSTLDPIFQITFEDIKHCWAQYWSLGDPMCARLPVWKEVLPHPALCAAHQRVPHTPHGWPQEAAVGNCTENLGKIQADNIHHLTHINRGCLGNLQIQLCNYVCRQISPLRHKHGVLPTKNNQNLNFGCIIQAAIPKHFQVDCSKKIIIFGEAGSEGQLIKALASLQRSLKI